MATHDQPKKRRGKVHGEAATLTKESARCYVSAGREVHFDLIVPDSVFHATVRKPTSCTLSTRSGDTRTAMLVFH
jgi:hypothetical protein